MGNSGTRCKGKIQDWCRDSCGCCPCSCCKTAQVEIKAQTVSAIIVNKGNIPFGYGILHPGVRTAENTFTSPLLEIHTWKESSMQFTTMEATMTQTVALGGMQTERDNANRHTGPSNGVTQLRKEVDESTVIIPVESILSIKYSTEIKKGHTECQRVIRDITPKKEYTTCERLTNWCQRTFCCCCCDEPEKQVSKPDRIVTTIGDEHAERKIIVTIEYIHYSNIHTPSHVRVLQTIDQAQFYQRKLQEETLQFYLMDNRQIEQNDFNTRQKQAAILCRLVTQLKSMIGHYPDEPTLEQIVNKRSALTIGEPPTETVQRINGIGNITNPSLHATVPNLALKN